MKKVKWKGVAISLIVIAVVVGMFFLIINVIPFCSSKQNAEKVLSRNEEDFFIVTKYLSNYKYSSVNIWTDDGTVFVWGGESGWYEEIIDETVKEAVEHLFARGIESVSRNEHSIIFLRWTRFNNFSSGIVCSTDSNKEPIVDFITKLESLSIDNWYYYEADYNEWRNTNTGTQSIKTGDGYAS